MSSEFIFRVGEFLCWVGAGIYTFLSNKDRVTHDQLKAFDEKLDAQELALARFEERIEERISHMPTEQTLTSLARELGHLRGAVDGFREEAARIVRQYERIDDWLKRQL